MILFLALAACAPSDGTIPLDDSGATDTDTVVDTDTDTDVPVDDSGETVPNTAPTAAEIVITPTAPAPGVDFGVVIVTPSTDADGDPVTYSYAWTQNGTPAAVTDATVPGADAVLLDVWEVTVTPTDGKDAGPPSTASVTIGNSPPTVPVISLSPTEPTEGDDLVLTFDVPSVDPDGDPLTTTIQWYDTGSYFAALDNLTTVPGRYVDNDEEFRAVVSVTDGFHDPVVVEASVVVAYTCANPPPGALSETTLTDAVAYHGIVFDDLGNLIGYDGRSGLWKSEYTGASSLFVPLTGAYPQQMDRLEDGDIVVADSTNARLLRVTASGGSSTFASSVGSAYGVVVGPDGDVWVANGGISRVDKDTGAVTTVLAAGGSVYAHSLAFNLDSTILYIGVIGAGTIYQLSLDSELNAVGSPSVYATGVGAGYHDGLEIDECGNLYAADYSTRGFYRIQTDGTVTPMVASDATGYGHGAKWGTGIGGWRDDAIYQPQPYNGDTIREVVIGFHSGDTVRTWNGVPAPL